MTLPRFLIIGAMKSGTTSLYRDLCANPVVFMPDDKEPHSLCGNHVLTDAGRAEYERYFAKARPEQICGEASTGYTKSPDHPGVPGRAQQVLGGNLKLIYLVREPVARIISHHHHSHSTGVFDSADINIALHRFPQMIDWSRYAMQARLWIEAFGRDNLLIMRFEEYVADRRSGVEIASRFLGIEPRPDLIDVQKIHNRSAGKPVARGVMRRFIDGPLYRGILRPLIPRSAKNRLRDALLPRAASALAPPSPETVAWIIEQLRDDMEDLRLLLQRDSAVWDMDAVLARYRSAAAV